MTASEPIRQMPILSTRAAERIRALMPADDGGEPWLRIGVQETTEGIGYTFCFDDERNADDTELDFGTLAILVEPDAREHLHGTEIDYLEDEEGPRFVIRRSRG